MGLTYTTQTYSGYTMHIITAKSEATLDVQLSVMALPYSTSNNLKRTIDWRDSSLESGGWTRRAVINGGLFFTQSNVNYANGIERAYSVTNENDDASLNAVMAFAHSASNSNAVVLDTQANIAANINSYRGAITGAFGLLRNGVVDQGNTSLQGEYSSKSGRSLVGSKSDGTIYFVSVAGVTGSTGLTGAELLAFAQSLGLYNAIAMDGGGSVGLVYEDAWKINSTRLVKNAIAIYTRSVAPSPPPVTPPSLSKPWGFVNIGGAIKQITKVKTKVAGADKTINKIFQKIGGVLKQVYQYEFTVTRFPQQFGTSITWTGGYSASGYVSATNNPYINQIYCSSVHASHGMPPSYVFTGDTYWTGQAWKTDNAGDSSWITIKFNGYLKVTSHRVYGSSMGHQTLDYPRSWYLQGSNDNASWVTISNPTAQYCHETWTGWLGANTTSYYQFIRLYCYENGGACNPADGNGCDLEINEIEFQGVFRPFY